MGIWNNSHMNELEARISIRLEINALVVAFYSEGDDRLSGLLMMLCQSVQSVGACLKEAQTRTRLS
ncbi:MAG: hypothetical protein FWE34_03760 [Defluviitaleaceae bacterium]|nr:hypothetical protein [Defluviitaleaceae bacterium]